MKHTVFSLSISLFLFFSSAGFSQSAKSYAFINASLFNGKENKIYSGSVIFTKGGKIEPPPWFVSTRTNILLYTRLCLPYTKSSPII